MIWSGATSQSDSASLSVSLSATDGVVEVVEGCFECGEGADVDDAVFHSELIEVDELQRGRGGVGCLGGAGEHVDSDVAVLGDARDEAGQLRQRAVERALGVGEILGGLREDVTGLGDLAILEIVEAIEQPEVAVAGGGARLRSRSTEPGDGNGGQQPDADGGPHDSSTHVLASADVAGDTDEARGSSRDDRREQEELVPFEAQRDLHDDPGDHRSGDGLVGLIPADPRTHGEGNGGRDDPDVRARERADQSDAGAGHERPPRCGCAEPRHECGEAGDEDDVGGGRAGGGRVGQGRDDRRDRGDSGDARSRHCA